MLHVECIPSVHFHSCCDWCRNTGSLILWVMSKLSDVYIIPEYIDQCSKRRITPLPFLINNCAYTFAGSFLDVYSSFTHHDIPRSNEATVFIAVFKSIRVIK